ncbi:hypothetical protein M501DRAFT_999469 [Patellaria atrata CBS 101060]|uniref:Transcriptional co-activator n=1 Tax=Patellaria atrata CBS 101060 TaxID=1346257 RepID=A0A9P4VN01_9PEZI|nr:hypothetical protein M501DRAFT_999469 [Patellaria atrata CBS 101060]
MASMNPRDAMNNPTSTPTLASRTLSTPNGTSSKPAKPSTVVERINVEPLYTELKRLVGDNWGTYKDTISLFVQGHLNQEELSRKIDHFICIDPNRIHLHNQLICAIFGNASRDPPDPGVANWVSANDKPTTVAKQVAGDAAEQRLKAEIMQLPARDRHRLKSIQDIPADHLFRVEHEYHTSRQVAPPDLVPASAGGFNKTNWDLEIRKRYAQPLFSETAEFPDPDTLAARMTPICYEEGVTNGPGPNCADFINVATETFIKEVLTHLFSHVRVNGPNLNYIKTARYRKQLEREERLAMKGELQRNPAGLLPVEQEAQMRHKPLDLGDLRLAIQLGDPYLSQVAVAAERITTGTWAQWWEDEEERGVGGWQAPTGGLKKINGVSNGVLPFGRRSINGVNGTQVDKEKAREEDGDWGWTGGAKADRERLNGVLDEVLRF